MNQFSKSQRDLPQTDPVIAPARRTMKPGRLATLLPGIGASLLILFYLCTSVVAAPSALASQVSTSHVTSGSAHASVQTATTRSLNGNPWGYSFSGHKLIYSPASLFCSYFACIHNFWNGRGFVVECHDKKFSKSGGIRGACSYHHGVWRALYRP